jgi:hypothetical protein
VSEIFHIIVPSPVWGGGGPGRAIETWYRLEADLCVLCDRDGVDLFDTDLKPRARKIREGETARFVAHRLARAMSLERPVGGDFNRRLDYSRLNFKY